MNFIRVFIQAVRAERIRAKRKWMYRDRIVRSMPKYDPRSSIEMHKRILGETAYYPRRQAF